MAAEVKLDFPTRRSVETLFRELLHGDGYYTPSESDKVHEQMRELEEEICYSTPKYKALRRKYDRLNQEEREDKERRRELVNKVRRKYLAEGLTPEVLKQIKQLVKELGK